MRKIVNVLYQFDNKYAPYAGVSLTSLLENNQGMRLCVYLAAWNDVSGDNMDRFDRLCGQYGAESHWLETDEAIQQIEEMKLGAWNGSMATWLKMFILDQLPSDARRILYIDCDTLVAEGVEEAFYCDLHGKSIGAVLDSLGFYQAVRLRTKEYYNAGVILFDLARMRSCDMFSRMRECARENGARYTVNDEDMLNDLWADDICMLPIACNLQGIHLFYDTAVYLKVYARESYYSLEQIEEAKRRPVITHFFRMIGQYPWEEGNIHPCNQSYHQWKAASLWSDIPDLKRRLPLVFTAERFLYQFLPAELFLRLYKRIVEGRKGK